MNIFNGVFDPVWSYEVKFNGPLTTVIVSNLDLGVSGRGHALCSFGDDFDEGFGEQLAASRAWERAYRKVTEVLRKGISE